MKKYASAAVLVAAAALALSGCGAAPTDSSTNTASTGSSTAASNSTDFLACMVSDAGGFDDKSFNQSGAAGLEQAVTDLGITTKLVESDDGSDFAPNLTSLKAQNCGLTVTVGFNLSDATKAMAEANPDIKYAIVDDAAIELPNVKSLVFKTSDASFLAGYAAAAYSKTGTVATFGGMNIPTVTIFMDGFVDGVARYNEDFSKDVKVLGWDKASQNGTFTGDFDDLSKGQNTATSFIDQGADVIMPVAGPVGGGAAVAAQSHDGVAIIWVDTDGYVSAPEYKDLFLTSVVKEIPVAVYDTVKATVDGQFSADPYIGTLANEGVGIAPFHDYEDQISQEVKDKLDQLKADIADGTLEVTSISDPAA